MNISNLKNVENFIRTAKTTVANLNAKYHDGEFADPANFDPIKNPIPVTWENANLAQKSKLTQKK